LREESESVQRGANDERLREEQKVLRLMK
jgi:hypothetical protein